MEEKSQKIMATHDNSLLKQFEAFDAEAFADDAIANAQRIFNAGEAFGGDERSVLRRKLNAAETDIEAACDKLHAAMKAGVEGAEEQWRRLSRFRMDMVPEHEKTGHPVWEGEVLAQAADLLRRKTGGEG